ncbi:Xylulose kinase [Fasciola hepatica]|uniref:Xylulose kinase n=1 Tax=Fasciola hepatica TaxID=6192 RepID=A0A4E0S3D2_FASHE|nr:Xylulose kinase [Fasciola hepatica]
MAHVIFIGLDYSTQQLKAVLTDSNCCLVQEEAVIFDRDLSNYNTISGVIRNGSEVFTPTLLWVEATELILKRLKDRHVDLSHVKAISGCGQQHGSVYWRKPLVLSTKSEDDLKTQLKESFSRPNSPVWMDASSSKQCIELEERLGGPLILAQKIGTKVFSRFTCPIILRIKELEPEVYDETAKISLVSSFAASLWTGHLVPFDYADACGTGLFSLSQSKLDQDVCKNIDENLQQKIDAPVPSHTIVGNVSPYIHKKYGIPATCKVVAFTGDNPSCVAGLLLKKGEICLSLGTSDTLFFRRTGLPNQTKETLGIFVMTDPIEEGTYISLICTRNGALVRDHFCREYANGDWNRFSELLRSSPFGNYGNLGLFLDQPEILPENLQGRFLVDMEDRPIGSGFGDPKATFSRADITIRALIEGQLVRKRVYLARMGVIANDVKRLIVTGGGSRNQEILDIAAGVFGADVYTVKSPNSAALGSAFRAKHALVMDAAESTNKPTFFDIIKCPHSRILASKRPPDSIVQIFDQMAERFKKLEQMALKVVANVTAKVADT